MIDALIRTFLRAPILALIVCVALAAWGWFAFLENPKDAIPDISENQAIVFSEWLGRSPKDVDEQVTYPLTVALQGVPGVREIRATSGFGWSIIYVVFHDDIEFYWARSRVLERLNVVQAEMPEGVIPTLGPDATALGQVFWYTVENGWYSPERPGLRFEEDGTLTAGSRRRLLDTSPELAVQLDAAEPFTCPVTGVPLVFSSLPLDRLRSIQDYDVRLALQGVEGVSEVASIGGYVRQYQIDVNPDALRAFDVSLGELVRAIRASNIDVGAMVVEDGAMGIMVRGVGFLGGGDRSTGPREQREEAAIRDIENIVVQATDGTPIYVRQLGTIATGPEFRDGALDKMGAEAVGASVIMRYGENPLTVIERVRYRIAEIEPGLPPGVRISAFYDRTNLIYETMATLGTALSQALVIVVVAVVLFLLHFRSSFVVAITLPLAVLFAFICMQALQLPSNIMSLAGIAIAIGTMVDMGIVMMENIYQHLTYRRDEYIRTETADDGSTREVTDGEKRLEIIREAAAEVGPAIITALSTTIVSFLPVFFLEGQAAKLFTPLAWTKTFCIVGALLMALVVVPPVSAMFLRHHRLSRAWAAVVAVVAALGASMAWFRLMGPGGVFDLSGHALREYLGVARPWDALAVGFVLGLIAYAICRERIRPIEANPVSRVIHRVYEPTLRWILHHKLLFLVLPAVLLVWGLSVWLGAGTVFGVLLWPLAQIGVHPEQWSLAFWVYLAIGIIVGCVLVPLVMGTLRLWRTGSSVPDADKWWPRVRRGIALAVTVALTAGLLGLHELGRATGASGLGVANLLAAPLSAVFGMPPISAETQQPVPPGEFALIRDGLGDHTGIGREFMPPLDEGDFLYMPSLLPAASINTVLEVMQKQDVQFARIPEVAEVVGKLGRIESALDEAPLGMIETMILLKPRDQWPLIAVEGNANRERRRTMTEIWRDIEQAGRFPGVLPSVRLQPIETRIEMLATGLRAPIGVKIYGDSVEGCEEVAVAVEGLLRERLEGAASINAGRMQGAPYLEFRIDREAVARFGVNVQDVQDVIQVAIGGMNLTTTYEGLDRYPVRARYQRELRDDLPELERILVPTPDGAQIPITQVAQIELVIGPMAVRREGPRFYSAVTMVSDGVDEVTLVRRGEAVLAEAIADGTLQMEGYSARWVGTYERVVRTQKRLMILVPLVLLINFVLIYLQFKRLPLTLVIFIAIPVSFAGGFILLDWWPTIHNALYEAGVMEWGFEGDAMYLTTAIWVGFIALFGIAVDDGIVLGTYLTQAFSRNPIRRYEDIEERVVEAGLRRIRPCLMTSFTTLAALTPVMLSTGRGSDVMVPMAVPVFGGMLVVLVSLFVVPTCYCGIKQLKWRLGLPDRDFAPEPARGTS